jgi:hypothetical protein
MLCWRSQSGGVPVIPACLEGWTPRGEFQLVHRETGKGHVVGVGHPLVWREPREWFDVEDGWAVALVPGVPFDPRAISRSQAWADVETVEDIDSRRWLAPKIRRKGGGRAFRHKYGRNWLPSLTPEQTRAEEIAKAAVEAIDQDTPISVACQWAAELLSITHHVTPEALAALSLVDDLLAIEVLRVASALEVSRGD